LSAIRTAKYSTSSRTPDRRSDHMWTAASRRSDFLNVRLVKWELTTSHEEERADGARLKHHRLTDDHELHHTTRLDSARYPGRLAGLVLTAPFVPVARNGRSSLTTAADYAHHRALFLAGSRARRRQRSSGGDLDLRAPASGLAALTRFGLRPAAFHAVGSRVSCPVLIVHGSDDHYVPSAFALGAAARHPTWQLATIPRAGHFPHRDNAGSWLAIVDPFLRHLLRQ
jgi:fermentation-respiration switch protein FrsA (DUF1100 family)